MRRTPLAASGHGYLAWLAPLVALALAAACGLARRASVARRRTRRRALAWLGASASLLAIYVVQETIEASPPGARGCSTTAAGSPRRSRVARRRR